MIKVTEWCPHCEQEVEIDAIKCTNQKCPVCGHLIKACSLCDHNNCNCIKCEKENE